MKRIQVNNKDEVKELEGFLSYSKITSLNRDPSTAFTNKSTPAMEFGSLVDALLSETEEVFKEKYFIMPEFDITDKMKEFADRFIELYNNDEEGNSDKFIELAHESYENSLILQARQDIGFNKTLKDETVIKQFKEACGTYIECVFMAEGRIIVNKSDYNDAVKLVEMIKTGPYTKDLFEHPSYTLLWQVPFAIETEYGNFKGIKDLVVIDNINKTVRTIDLKTTSSSYLKFEESYWKWRYDVQDFIYTLDNELYAAENELMPLETRFLIAEKSMEHYPVFFQMEDVSPILDPKGLGSIRDLILNANWYLENQSFDFIKEVQENDGVLIKEYVS